MAQGLGIGQDKLSQALKMSDKYSKDINGLKQVINDNGGNDFLNKALNFANSPLARIALSKIGITPEVLEGLKKDLGVNSNNSTSQNYDIMERLKRLK